ncbi:universal stress protein [Variovorax soli]|uniref:Nucleotide-binding universal stress UspA family protein n=1 Tax=Variovorax soli TaxID=376815 RepID=A0ABU1NFY4_9BURK|nr:universal stress protein [Variovorax soli]MDR6536776.1 nucleotide-binding universal stress UspA family protein [Variovorax soli]
MNFKTILVHLDHTDRCRARVALATRIAKAQGGHLVGLLPNGLLDGTIPANALPTGMTDFIAESAHYLRQRADGISEGFRAVVNAADAHSHEVREVEGTTIDELIAHGRSSDLIVLGQEDSATDSDVPARGLVPQVMLHAGRPVLVVPYAGDFGDLGKNVLLAWDGSRAAALAMREALPLLAGARRVTLASFRGTGADAGEALLIPEMLRWLERHGVQPRAEQDVVEIDISDALLSRVSDLGADLIVMGGYGHSRLREMVLGGVTREVLSHMTVPVLIAH